MWPNPLHRKLRQTEKVWTLLPIVLANFGKEFLLKLEILPFFHLSNKEWEIDIVICYPATTAEGTFNT